MVRENSTLFYWIVVELVDTNLKCEVERIYRLQRFMQVQVRLLPIQLIQIIYSMAKISQERILIREKLKVQGDKVVFPLSLYMKISRIVQEMNKIARIERLITTDEVLYSIRQEGAPQGNFFVIRNL